MATCEGSSHRRRSQASYGTRHVLHDLQKWAKEAVGSSSASKKHPRRDDYDDLLALTIESAKAGSTTYIIRPSDGDEDHTINIFSHSCGRRRRRRRCLQLNTRSHLMGKRAVESVRFSYCCWPVLANSRVGTKFSDSARTPLSKYINIRAKLSNDRGFAARSSGYMKLLCFLFVDARG